MESSDELLERAALDGSLDVERWGTVLENILLRFEDIVHHGFPRPTIDQPAQTPRLTSPELLLQQSITSSTPNANTPPNGQANGHQANKENDPPSSPPRPSPSSVPSFPLPPSSLSAPPDSSSTTTQVPLTQPALPPHLQSTYTNIVTSLQTRFLNAPPHTIQRLAELILRPKQHYRFLHSYLNALDRIISVSSGTTIFPLPAVDSGSTSGPLVNGTAPNNTSSTSTFDETIGGATLTPIPWLRSDSGGSSPSGSNTPSRRTSAAANGTENDAASDQLTFVINEYPSALQPDTGAITQGELLRQEQVASDPPPAVTAAQIVGASGSVAGSVDGALVADELEQPHARGPDTIGPEDTGPQEHGLGAGQALDIDAAVGRPHEEGHPTGATVHVTHAAEGEEGRASAAEKDVAEQKTEEAEAEKKDYDGDVVISDAQGQDDASKGDTQPTHEQSSTSTPSDTAEQ